MISVQIFFGLSPTNYFLDSDTRIFKNEKRPSAIYFAFMIKLISSSLVALVLSVAPTIQAQNMNPNLVVNPGFETGDFTGYTTIRAPNKSLFGVTTTVPHSGSDDAYFGSIAGQYDTIYQTLATIPGATYDVGFYLANGDTTGYEDSFVADFGNATLLTLNGDVGAGAGVYIYYSETVTASSSSTVFSFSGYNEPSYYYLDDLSVNLSSVPEPSSWAMFGLGTMGAIAVAMRRRITTRAHLG